MNERAKIKIQKKLKKTQLPDSLSFQFHVLLTLPETLANTRSMNAQTQLNGTSNSSGITA
jgi:hypothetical protein